MRHFRRCLTSASVAIAASGASAQTVTEVRLATPSPLIATVVARSAPTVAGVSIDDSLRVWDTQARRLAQVIDVSGRDMALLAVSSDGRLILMADYASGVTIWNVATGQVEWRFSVKRYLTAAAFSRDGRLLAFAAGSPVQVFDVGTHRLLRKLESTPGTTSVVFSRDGTSLATTDGDGVRVYDVRSGRLTAKNDDFVGVPLAADFSADGKSVLSAGGDRHVLSIDVATGRTIRQSASLTDPIFYLEISPSGREVAAVTQNADDPQRPAPIVFTDITSAAPRGAWRAPSGVLLPGATWTTNGQFLVVTQRADTFHVWSIRP